MNFGKKLAVIATVFLALCAGASGADTSGKILGTVNELVVSIENFRSYKRSDIAIDLGSAVQLEVRLEVAGVNESVTVTEDATQVETSDTKLGQVIGSKQVTGLPLNGRSYTDLLAIQRGVTPISTSGAGNSTSGGGFGTVPVAGNSSTGQFSINGQRESANGFYLNGASVQETIGQQAGIVPNLDSIAEFRILSSNADAECGGYSGGLINVVTKFGGTMGGPVRKNKLFFLGDYQGQPDECGRPQMRSGLCFCAGDPLMGHNILIAHKERERAALLQLARDIVEAGDRRGRPLSPGEDGMVTKLVKKARALEHEINLFRRDQQRAIPSKHREAEDV